MRKDRYGSTLVAAGNAGAWPELNCSLSKNFWTLPDPVSGKASVNTQWRGVLWAARRRAGGAQKLEPQRVPWGGLDEGGDLLASVLCPARQVRAMSSIRWPGVEDLVPHSRADVPAAGGMTISLSLPFLSGGTRRSVRREEVAAAEPSRLRRPPRWSSAIVEVAGDPRCSRWGEELAERRPLVPSPGHWVGDLELRRAASGLGPGAGAVVGLELFGPRLGDAKGECSCLCEG